MDKKKILITGSCGFILRSLVYKIIHDNLPYQVVSLDRVSSHVANNIYWNKSHAFHIADIRDKHIMDVIFQIEMPDIVIHGAAEMTDPEHFFDTNMDGTQNIVDSCIKHKIGKLIYISDSIVYKKHVMPTEETPIKVVDLAPYALSKAGGEKAVKDAAMMHGLIYNIVRLSNAYGHRQTTIGLIPKVMQGILQEREISLPNDGSTSRDWTHVFDHCSAILSVLNSGQDNEIYNVSANQELTDIEVAWKVCNVMEKGHNLITYDKKPDDGNPLIDSSKIKQIGWEPQYKFKRGVIETTEWFKKNQWFLK